MGIKWNGWCFVARDGSSQRCGMMALSHETYCASGRRSGSDEAGSPRTRYQMSVMTMVAAKRIAGTGNGSNVIRAESGARSAICLAEARNGY